MKISIMKSQISKSYTEKKSKLEAEKVVISEPEINLCYETWIKEKEDLNANESLIGDEYNAFDEDNSDDGMFQVELCARLKAGNEATFTALDLMYQVEQQVSNKELSDHIFFEGLVKQKKTNNKTVVHQHIICIVEAE